MKFRDKIELILSYRPNVAIISECENIDKIKCPVEYNCLWIGDNNNKGLAIFSSQNISLNIASWYNPNFKYILPAYISGNILIFAVWACRSEVSNRRYIEMIHEAILYYQPYIDADVIIAGDFNSNAIWDNEHKKHGSHTQLVDIFSLKQIYSSYHYYYNESQGHESLPTIFFQKNEQKPYHIDYCFLSNNLLNKVSKVEVGSYNNWIKYSDHMPIIVDL